MRSALHHVLAERVGAVGFFRVCPECGSPNHGVPSVRVSEGAVPSVSLSYADGVGVVAWSYAGVVGVDIERVGSESLGELQKWTAAEATAKTGGRGLVHGDLGPSTSSGQAKLDQREVSLDLTALDLGPGLVASIAVSGAGRS